RPPSRETGRPRSAKVSVAGAAQPKAASGMRTARACGNPPFLSCREDDVIIAVPKGTCPSYPQIIFDYASGPAFPPLPPISLRRPDIARLAVRSMRRTRPVGGNILANAGAVFR